MIAHLFSKRYWINLICRGTIVVVKLKTQYSILV
uniref:Bm14183 n=1 Tax=Brugia malayi TaxID=6279 RepID=A0A1I9G1P1_BRUMA|nr:Bm14183 [Brugia malayi]